MKHLIMAAFELDPPLLRYVELIVDFFLRAGFSPNALTM